MDEVLRALAYERKLARVALKVKQKEKQRRKKERERDKDRLLKEKEKEKQRLREENAKEKERLRKNLEKEKRRLRKEKEREKERKRKEDERRKAQEVNRLIELKRWEALFGKLDAESRKTATLKALLETLKINGKKIPVFIAIDGEGVHSGDRETRLGKEKAMRYALLMCGDRYIVEHRPLVHLGLQTIFEFLWNCFLEDYKLFCKRYRHPVAYVGFFLKYDHTYWLGQLPENRSRYLLCKEEIAKRRYKLSNSNNTRCFHPVRIDCRDSGHEWEFDMLPTMMRFKLRKVPKGLSRKDKSKIPWLTICDVGAFWQCSLISAADPDVWPNGTINRRDYERVMQGKKKRSVFTKITTEIIEYTKAENRLLTTIMTEFAKGCASLPIPLVLDADDWMGPGRLASLFLRKIGARRAEDYKEKLPPGVFEAGYKSYYGGRFEITRVGIVGDVYEYDITSAYPFALTKVLDWLEGSWEYYEDPSLSSLPDYCIVRIEAWAPHDSNLGPFPYRYKNGKSICFPLHVEGWYWLHEVKAAMRAGLVERYVLKEAWAFYPKHMVYPFLSVVDMFEERRRCGKKSPKGIALKLAYNSLYGKLAQTAGDTPPFTCMLSAGFITSHTRAKILDAIATHPQKAEGVVMIATDGIYFKTRHPTLGLGSNLGDWEESFKENLTIIKPGFYWSKNAENRLKTLKTRGVPAKDFERFINEFETSFIFCDDVAYISMAIPRSFFFVTPRLALHRNRWDTCGDLALTPLHLSFGDLALKRKFAMRFKDNFGSWFLPPIDELDPVLSEPFRDEFSFAYDREHLFGEHWEHGHEFRALMQFYGFMR